MPDHRTAADRAGALARQVADHHGDQVLLALRGNRGALLALLNLAVAAGRDHATAVNSGLRGVAERMDRFADRVATAYSAERPPDDRDCDEAFALAQALQNLAAALPPTTTTAAHQPGRATTLALGARHAARAHAAELAAAAARHRPVEPADAAAAEYLYQLIRDLGRLTTEAPDRRGPA